MARMITASVMLPMAPTVGMCNADGALTEYGRPKQPKRDHMPIERETIVTPSVDRQTVVTDRGAGSGLVMGILLVVVILLVVGGMTVFNGGFSFGGKSVTVDIPKVTVTK